MGSNAGQPIQEEQTLLLQDEDEKIDEIEEVLEFKDEEPEKETPQEDDKGPTKKVILRRKEEEEEKDEGEVEEKDAE